MAPPGGCVNPHLTHVLLQLLGLLPGYEQHQRRREGVCKVLATTKGVAGVGALAALPATYMGSKGQWHRDGGGLGIGGREGGGGAVLSDPSPDACGCACGEAQSCASDSPLAQG